MFIYFLLLLSRYSVYFVYYDSIATYIYNNIVKSAMCHKSVINNLSKYQDIFQRPQVPVFTCSPPAGNIFKQHDQDSTFLSTKNCSDL